MIGTYVLEDGTLFALLHHPAADRDDVQIDVTQRVSLCGEKVPTDIPRSRVR